MVNRLSRATALALALLSAGLANAAETGLPAPRRATPQPASQPASLSKNDVLILVRSTLIALSQANQTGNYTVLRDLGSPEFQAMNSASRLGDIFKPLRMQTFDLSGTAVLEPQLSLMPQIDKTGQLHMSGYFPSVPLQVRFDMAFLAQDHRWTLSSLSVALASSAPEPGPVPDDKRPAAGGGSEGHHGTN